MTASVVNQLTSFFWFLDPFHSHLQERSCHIPDNLAFHGYQDYQLHKKKKPVLMCKELEEECGIIGNILLMPWIQDEKNKLFKTALSALFDSLNKYIHQMKKHQQQTADHHASMNPVRNVNDNWTLLSLPVRSGKSSALTNELDTCQLYHVVHLGDFLPTKSNEIKPFLDTLCFPYPVTLMTYAFGNNLGNLYFVWKTSSTSEEEPMLTAVNYVLRKLPHFSTRAMRKQFLDKYTSVAKPHILRNMWQFVTKDESAGESSAQEEVDLRVIEYFLGGDDPELVVDLRKNNGKTADPKYDTFWAKLQSILDEKCVVNERRTDEIAYLPDWISVRDLREDVLSQCPAGTEAPSESWIRLNFHPTNPYLHTAAHYTGRFNVKYRVQQRLLRANIQILNSVLCFGGT